MIDYERISIKDDLKEELGKFLNPQEISDYCINEIYAIIDRVFDTVRL